MISSGVINGQPWSDTGLTADMQAWANTGGYGAIGFVGYEAAGAYTYQSDGIYLYVQYDHVPSTPALNSPANGTNAHTQTTLSATSGDADGGSLQYVYQVWTAPSGGNLVWHAETAPVGQGSPSSAVVTVGSQAVMFNTPYYWSVFATDGIANSPGSGRWEFQLVNSPPSIPTAQSPGSATTAVIDTSTAAFAAGGSTDPDPGDTVPYYRFQVATGADGQSGRLITSGWAPGLSWTPPAGTFQDGGTYYWTVQAEDNWGSVSPWAQPAKFKVDFRLGADSTLPYDQEGPVSVNLSTGNAVVSDGGPHFATVDGSVGVNFTYNAQSPVRQGLTGQYWQDPAGTGQPGGAGTTLVLTERDTALSFNWGGDGPNDGPAPGSINPDHWVACWSGYLSTPGTDRYVLVANTVDDSVSATVAANPALSASVTNQPQTGTYQFSGTNLPFTVTYAQITGGEYLDVRI